MLSSERIGKIFLLVVAIALSLGMINAFQQNLNILGGGNTHLARQIAASFTENQQSPFQQYPHYEYKMAPADTLYQSLYLDPEIGKLMLRQEALVSPPTSNPL